MDCEPRRGLGFGDARGEDGYRCDVGRFLGRVTYRAFHFGLGGGDGDGRKDASAYLVLGFSQKASSAGPGTCDARARSSEFQLRVCDDLMEGIVTEQLRRKNRRKTYRVRVEELSPSHELVDHQVRVRLDTGVEVERGLEVHGFGGGEAGGAHLEVGGGGFGGGGGVRLRCVDEGGSFVGTKGGLTEVVRGGE